MKLFVISSLFPSSVHPNRGIFVLRRLVAVSQTCDVVVVNPIPWFPFQGMFKQYRDLSDVPSREVIQGIDVYHPRYLSIPLLFKVVAAIGFSLSVLMLTIRVRRKFAFDLIELNWTFPDLPAGLLLSRLYGVKQIVTIRGEPALGLHERNMRSRIVRFFLPRADRVVTLSNRLRTDCLTMGVLADQLQTVHNGVDSSRFQYENRSESRKRLQLPDHQRIILGIGFMTPRKGFDRIVKALPEINRRFGETHLFIIGPTGEFAQGDCSRDLDQLAVKLGVRDKLTFVGEVENHDLPRWYNAVDCFCLSSRSEGCPNVFLEALACGCPCVATDVGSVPDIMNSSMGMVVPNSSEGVELGLLDVLSREFDRQGLVEQMKAFDWNSCARQMLDIYDQLLRPAAVEAISSVPEGETSR